MKVEFLGATQTVTGSRYLVHANGSRLLIDCGLYQGLKALRLRNWRPLPFAVTDIDAVVLSHAHIDHSGYLPGLYKQGYRGPVYCSAATRALCEVLLPDAGYLQEEDAHYANRKRFSRHDPAAPLFTEDDARRVLQQFHVVDTHAEIPMVKGVDVTLIPAGHILGACSVLVNDGAHRLAFSGDLGRSEDPIMRPPEHLLEADGLVVESTYGNRVHAGDDVEAELGEVVTRTVERGGIVLVPAFAVGRAQMVLYLLYRLRCSGRIPDVPVYLNSPMAIKATEIFSRFHTEHRLDAEACERIDKMTVFVRDVADSIALSGQRFPSVIVSASGMASGGRVLHHLKVLAGNYRNSIVFAGFQAPGTRGAAMVAGAETVKIHGHHYPVEAEVINLDSLSAHADANGIMDWLRHFRTPPRQTFVTHGEAVPADTLRARIKHELGWHVTVPEYRDSALID